LLKKGKKWEWSPLHSKAFELCKQVLTNAPAQGYALLGLPCQLYSDACNFGLAAILQQVQKIQLKDLKGTKAYEGCKKAFKAGEPIPSLVIQIPINENWCSTLNETWVHIE